MSQIFSIFVGRKVRIVQAYKSNLQVMLFQELRELKTLVDKYNQKVVGQKAEFFNPHMYRDGRWAVTIVFGKAPTLYDMWDILNCCYYHGLKVFFGEMCGDIALFIQ